MAIVSLQPIATDGESFWFSFVSGVDPINIDFVGSSAGTILLHISLRPLDEKVVLNSAAAGVWESEIVIEWPRASAYAPTKLGLMVKSSDIALEIDGAQLWKGVWGRHLELAKGIELDRDDIHVARGPYQRIQHTLDAELSAISARPHGAYADVLPPVIKRTLEVGKTIGFLDLTDKPQFQLHNLARLAEQFDKLILFNGPTDLEVAAVTCAPNIAAVIDISFANLTELLDYVGLQSSDDTYIFPLSDRVIYPSDYSARLVSIATEYGGTVGGEGSFLITDGIGGDIGDVKSHIAANAAFAATRRVHILGLDTACIPLNLIARQPFTILTSNLGFARHCSVSGVPLYVIPRKEDWLRTFDKKEVVQTAVESALSSEVARVAPLVKGIKPKVMIAIKTYNREFYVRECLGTVVATLDNEDEFDINIVVADDGSEDDTLQFLSRLSIPFETHVIQNQRAYVSGQFNSILQLFEERRADFLIIVDDDVVFKKPGWLYAYFSAAMRSGYHHLCHFNLPHFEQLTAKSKEPFPPPGMSHSQFPLVAYQTVERCMGALMTLTPEVVHDVGYADERNFAVRGLWHVDYSARACRAGYNEYARFFDIADAHEYLELQNTLKQKYVTSIAWHTNEFKVVSTPEERARRQRVVRIRDRVRVPLGVARRGPVLNPPAKPAPVFNLGNCFDGVYIHGNESKLLIKAAQSLRAAPVLFEPESQAAARELENVLQLSKDLTGSNSRRIGDEVILRRAAPISEIACAVAAAAASVEDYKELVGLGFGARGFYQRALSEAITLGYRNVLLLNGDVQLRDDFGELFDNLMAELPKNWRMLHLEASFAPYCEPVSYSSMLARNPGGAFGGNAIGLNGDAMHAALYELERNPLPAPLGAINIVARIWPERCFVARPSLIRSNAII